PSRLSALVRLRRGPPRAPHRLQPDCRRAGGDDARARPGAVGRQRRACGGLLPHRPLVSEKRTNLGWGALALSPIACCLGIPLIAAAGISVAVAAWAGGIAVGAMVLAAVLILGGLRVRRRRRRRAPALSVTRSRP